MVLNAYSDGYIPLWQCAIYYIIAIVAVAYSLKWSARNLTERNIPLFAVLAAGIFAVMSFNVPILGVLVVIWLVQHL